MNVEVGRDVGLKTLIVPHMQDLSPTLRLAADYILKNPDIAAMHSLRKVAEITDLNPPTFTRLAQSLGLRNYEQLRQLCRQEVQQGAGSFAGKAASLQRRRLGKGTFLPAHSAASVSNIENLIETTDLHALAQAAELLAKAHNVVLFGALSSVALIDYLSYTARMAFSHWRTLLRNHEAIGMELSALGPDDAMIVLAYKPYASRAVNAAQRARAMGVPVLAFTDSYAAPIAVDATHVFVTPTDSPHFFASAVPVMVLFEALLSMVVRRSGKKARERIAAIEHENHRSGEYWQG